MSSLHIPPGDLQDWLSVLKPYQKNTLNHFMRSMGPEGAAEKWLTTIGSPDIAAFGGAEGGNSQPYWERFKAECRKFVCDDTAYTEEKKDLLEKSPVSKAFMISTMSGAIGAYLGAPGTLIAPAVTVMLFTIGQIGRNAYCAPRS